MEPRQAWWAFSLVLVLLDLLLVVALLDLGFGVLPVLLLFVIVIVVYSYIVYKRYHVELVPEHDIGLFEDPDDLRILCGIYGLDTSGSEAELRDRLTRFSRANKGRAFVWVAPRSVLSLARSLSAQTTEAPAPTPQVTPAGLVERLVSSPAPGEQVGGLVFGKSTRVDASSISACPVCDAPAPRSGTTCSECGADLSFYAGLKESKVGKRLVSTKSIAVRRKLRYGVPAIGGKR